VNRTFKEHWVAWDEGRSFTYEGVGVPLMKRAVNRWSVIPHGEQSLLTSEAEVEFKGGVFGRMLEPILAPLMRRMAPDALAETIRERLAQTIQYVTPVPYVSATGLTADLYQQMRADFLPVPPLTLHSPVPHIMAGLWSILQETLHTGQVDRGIKEVEGARPFHRPPVH
jgi:hypothetical protein